MVWEIPYLGFRMEYIQDPSFPTLAHVLWLGMAYWERWKWEELVNEFLEMV